LIAVNKMDLVGYSQEVFERIVQDYTGFAARLSIPDLKFIPISALMGDNVVESSREMPWYTGESVLEYLENVYIGSDRNLIDLRFPVQYVQRPNLDFRGYAGQIVSGIVKVGDEVRTLPSMRTSRVKSIVTFDGELEYAFAPMSVTLTLEDAIDISRGDIIVHPRNLPQLQSSFEAMVVWMSEEPMDPARPYSIKHTTRTTKVHIQDVVYQVDVNTLHRSPAERLRLNEIGRVVFQSAAKLFIDAYHKNRYTGSFILVDPVSNNTVAAGMVIDRLPEAELRAAPDAGAAPRSENIRREVGRVTAADRQRLLGQRGLTIWLTGLSGSGKSSIAKEVERRLHEAGRHTYVLDGDNIRFGLNRDLSFSKADRTENIRRIAEVARLFNDAGTIVLVPVISPFVADRENARKVIGEDRFFEVFVDAPIEVCEQRDSKGLYRKARAGEISEFTGISSPYEPPESPALTLRTGEKRLEQCADAVLEAVRPRLRP
ncbi:MAG: adenylyl-sulfate kinase, partial [Planctomycetes bacterium]|nr:adenylyl-sulfate kinase [Planctomycetota bacterium]